MENFDLIFRKAKMGDDFAAIARYIHLTDPYIYPTVCKDPDSPFFYRLILRCIKDETNVFALNNLWVALLGNAVVGILCAVQCGKRLTLLENLSPSAEEYERLTKANKGYFLPLMEESLEYEGYNVVNLCVDPMCRGKGVGEGLLRAYLASVKGAVVHLDVIADNSSAVRLYERCGFEIEKEYNGFSGTESSLPCYHMVRRGKE